MLLTIHNLPSHVRYGDIKSLIQSKCGLTELILDNLVNEGQHKKVTVGLMEEEDAAVLIREINGLFVEGQMLFVEDVRQKKASEQSLHSKSMPPNPTNKVPINPWQSQQQPGFSFGMGCPNPFMQQDQNSMMMTPQMMGGMYFTQPQNSFSNYGGQAPTQPPSTPQYYQAMNSNEQNQDNSNNYSSNNNNREYSNQSQEWRPDDNNVYQQNQSNWSSNQQNDPRTKRTSRWQTYSNEDTRSNNRSRSRSPRREESNGRSSYDYKGSDNSSRADNYRQRNASSTDNYSETQKCSPSNDSYSNRMYGNNRQSQWDAKVNPPIWESSKPVHKNVPYYELESSNPPERNFQRQQQRYSSSSSGGNTARKVEAKSFESNAARNTPPSHKSAFGIIKNKPAVSDNKKKKAEKVIYPNFPTLPKNAYYQTLLHKDETWRQQASAKIRKEVVTEYPPDIKPLMVDKAVRTAINTRIELILKGEMGVLIDDIVKRYRKVFPKCDDKAFYDAIVVNIRKDILKKQEEAAKDPLKIGPVNTEPANTAAAGPSAAGTSAAAPSAATNVAPPVKQKSHVPGVKELPNTDPEIPSEGLSIYEVSTDKMKKRGNQPPPGRLPKYPQANKKLYSQQKKTHKQEFQDDNLYVLDPPLDLAVNEQIDKFCDLFKSAISDASDSHETFVRDKLLDESLGSFRKSLKVNLTKRILDIRTNLTVRIYPSGRPPKVAQVNDFLKPFGVISLKKGKGKKNFYIANLQSYYDYDRLCNLRSAPLNEATILAFKPFQLTGPKAKITKKKMSENRKQFIQNQEEFRIVRINEHGQTVDMDDDMCDEPDDEDMDDEEDPGTGEYDDDNYGSEQGDDVCEVNDEDFEDY